MSPIPDTPARSRLPPLDLQALERLARAYLTARDALTVDSSLKALRLARAALFQFKDVSTPERILGLIAAAQQQAVQEQKQNAEGKTENGQQQEPGLAPSEFFSPPSGESRIDAANREGFFEYSYKLLERRAKAWMEEVFTLRDALAVERERVEDLGAQLTDWRILAFRYGTETMAEKRLRTQNLYGTVTIARELVMQGDEAITHACVALAKKLRGAAKRPERVSVPASDRSRSSPDASALTPPIPASPESSDHA